MAKAIDKYLSFIPLKYYRITVKRNLIYFAVNQCFCLSSKKICDLALFINSKTQLKIY
jgi:hypothetical protein